MTWTPSLLPSPLLVSDALGMQLRMMHAGSARLWAAPKLDGVRCLAGVTTEGRVVYGTRSGLRWPTFTPLDAPLVQLAGLLTNQLGTESLRQQRPGPGRPVFAAVFDAELTTRDRQFDTVQRIALGGLAARYDELELQVFDVMSDGHNFETRYRALARVFADVAPGPVRLIPHVRLSRDLRMDALAALRDKTARRPGCEGLVLRLSDQPYGAEWDAVRLKVEDTEDLRVLQAVPMRADPSRLSALVCDRGGVRVRVGTGFDAAQRVALLNSPPVVVEVGHRGVTAKGSLRNPVFKRVRADKGAHTAW